MDRLFVSVYQNEWDLFIYNSRIRSGGREGGTEGASEGGREGKCSHVTGLEFGQFEGKASWPWLLKIIRGHRGQYAGHQGHWYLKQF